VHSLLQHARRRRQETLGDPSCVPERLYVPLELRADRDGTCPGRCGLLRLMDKPHLLGFRAALFLQLCEY